MNSLLFARAFHYQPDNADIDVPANRLCLGARAGIHWRRQGVHRLGARPRQFEGRKPPNEVQGRSHDDDVYGEKPRLNIRQFRSLARVTLSERLTFRRNC